jgi:hypothetical protein
VAWIVILAAHCPVSGFACIRLLHPASIMTEFIPTSTIYVQPHHLSATQPQGWSHDDSYSYSADITPLTNPVSAHVSQASSADHSQIGDPTSQLNSLPQTSLQAMQSTPVKSLKPHPSSKVIATTNEQGRDVLVFVDGSMPSGSFRLQMEQMQEGAQPSPVVPQCQEHVKPSKPRRSCRSLVHRHGPTFAFYSQFALVTCYYLIEYLTVLNILNRPRYTISGVPLIVLILTIANTTAFRAMRRLQILTLIVEFLCTAGLVVYDDISPHNMDDRHRTEYYVRAPHKPARAI